MVSPSFISRKRQQTKLLCWFCCTFPLSPPNVLWVLHLRFRDFVVETTRPTLCKAVSAWGNLLPLSQGIIEHMAQKLLLQQHTRFRITSRHEVSRFEPKYNPTSMLHSCSSGDLVRPLLLAVSHAGGGGATNCPLHVCGCSEARKLRLPSLHEFVDLETCVRNRLRVQGPVEARYPPLATLPPFEIVASRNLQRRRSACMSEKSVDLLRTSSFKRRDSRAPEAETGKHDPVLRQDSCTPRGNYVDNSSPCFLR